MDNAPVIGHDIVTIGASAGGFEALNKLVGDLPADLPAAVFVVVHLGEGSTGMLPRILDRAGPLEAVSPEDGYSAERGRVYVAPSGRSSVARTRRCTRGIAALMS